jgi:hypothetical protein
VESAFIQPYLTFAVGICLTEQMIFLMEAPLVGLHGHSFQRHTEINPTPHHFIDGIAASVLVIRQEAEPKTSKATYEIEKCYIHETFY